MNGGVQPYTWSVASGSLPDGMSLQALGEAVSSGYVPGNAYVIGRPMRAGSYNFILSVTDSLGATATQTVTWNITALSLEYTNLPVFSNTLLYNTSYSQQLLVIGGSGNYVSWTNQSAANLLPPGLTLNTGTGLVSGTATNTGYFSPVVRVSDEQGATWQGTVTLFVAGPNGVTVSLGAGPNLGTILAGSTSMMSLIPSGGTGPYTVTSLDPLPPGCTLVSGSSLPSGFGGTNYLGCLPPAGGTFTFTLKVQDSLGNAGFKAMTLTALPVALYSAALPNGSVGTGYSQQLLTFDSAGAVNWSLAPGSLLPAGLGLTGAVLSGTPTAAGSYSFNLTATDGASLSSANYSFTLTISNIAITSPSVIPVQGIYGSPYSYQFEASGGGAAKTWSATGLPSGLTMSTTGLLSGTLNAAGSYLITVTVTDGSSPVSKYFSFYSRYSDPAVFNFAVASTVLSDARIGVYYTTTLTPTGGTPPYNWALAPGSSLPAGLALYTGSALPPTLVSGSYMLAGMPTAAGHHSFDLIATDSAGASLRRTFTMNVTPVALLSGSLRTATVGVSYSMQLTAVGGTGPYTFTYSQSGISTPMFPPGLSVSTSGLISGTPGSTGAYGFYATATDTIGNSYRITCSLTVTNSAGWYISSSPPFAMALGQGILSNLSTSRTSTYIWSLVAGSLPPGLALSANGALSGTPTVSGSYTYTVRATDGADSTNFAERTYDSVSVSPMQFNVGRANASNAVPPAQVDLPYSYQFKVAGGSPPYAFATIPLYPLPPGLTLSASGLLSGTPTQTGSFTFYTLLSDSAGNSGYAFSPTVFVLRPGETNPLQGTSTALRDASVGVPAALPLSSVAPGGVPPVSFAVASGSTLPPGMAIVPGAYGVAPYLGGIPSTAGTYAFALAATDSAGQPAISNVTVTVSPIALSPKVPMHGTVGAPYSLTLTASGGTAPYTFTASSNSGMPPGLVLTANGLLSGTPTAAGLFNIYFTVTDAASHTLAVAYPIAIEQSGQARGINIVPLDVISMSYVRTAPAPSPLPVNITATSGAVPFTAMVGGVPGVSLSATSGSAPTTLSLTLDPTGLTAGIYSGVLAVNAPDAINGYTAIPVVLTVVDPPPCTYTLNPINSSVAAAGGSGSFDVSAGSLCPWTAVVSDASWISVNAGSGTGSSTLHFQAMSPNPGLTPRTGTITVESKVYTITQFGSSCSLAINPASTPATSSGGLATVNVTTSNQSCAWTAAGLSASPAGGTGNGSVTFTVPATTNATGQVLTASVQLTTGGTPATFTVNQTGLSCTVVLSATGASVASSGGDGSVNVTTPAGCTYSTVNGPSWITVTSGGSADGPGPVTLTYTVSPNSTTVSRVGTLTVGGHEYTITQDATPCSVTVDASSSGSPFGSTGGSGTLAVNANGANCTWMASSAAQWVTVSPPFGVGNGTLNLTVASNASSTTSRTADLMVAGQSVTMTQAGTVCTYALGSSTASVPYNGGTGRVTVTAPAVCQWTSTADTSASWLAIPSSGTHGTGDVVFTAAANPAFTARSGTLTVAGQAYTVTQAGTPCDYLLSRSNLTVATGGASDSFTFSTAATGCSAVAVSYSSWITVATASSADGSTGTVNFTAAANPAGSTRVGTIQFGAQAFTVTQLGAACAYSLAAYGLVLSKAGGTGTVLGSPSAVGCGTPPTSTDTTGIISLGTLTGPVLNIYRQPFSVSLFNATMTGIRRAMITFGGQVYTVKQTSW